MSFIWRSFQLTLCSTDGHHYPPIGCVRVISVGLVVAAEGVTVLGLGIGVLVNGVRRRIDVRPNVTVGTSGVKDPVGDGSWVLDGSSVMVGVGVTVLVGEGVLDGVDVGESVGEALDVIDGLGVVAVSVLVGVWVSVGVGDKTAKPACIVSVILSAVESGETVIVFVGERSPARKPPGEAASTPIIPRRTSKLIVAINLVHQNHPDAAPTLATITVTLSGAPRLRTSWTNLRAARSARLFRRMLRISFGSTRLHNPSLQMTNMSPFCVPVLW